MKRTAGKAGDPAGLQSNPVSRNVPLGDDTFCSDGSHRLRRSTSHKQQQETDGHDGTDPHVALSGPPSSGDLRESCPETVGASEPEAFWQESPS